MCNDSERMKFDWLSPPATKWKGGVSRRDGVVFSEQEAETEAEAEVEAEAETEPMCNSECVTIASA